MNENTFVLFDKHKRVFAVGFHEQQQIVHQISKDIKIACKFNDLETADLYANIYQTPAYFYEVWDYEDALTYITPSPKLYIVFLGGNLPPNRFGEDHEIVTVVANSQEEAKKLAKSKWSGYGKAHIDGIMQVVVVDGYKVNLTKVDGVSRQILETDWNKLNK
jgi:hypothetical protein